MVRDEISESDHNPIAYLRLIGHCSSLTHIVAVNYVLWMRSSKFLKLVQDFSKQHIQATAHLAWPVCVVFFASAIFVFIRVDLVDVISSESSTSKWVLLITHMFGMSDGKNFPEESMLPTEFYEQFETLLLRVLFLITTFGKRVISFGSDCLILMIALSAWHCAKIFYSQMETNGSGRMQFVDVVSRYESTKQLFAFINETAEPIILTYLLKDFLAYSIGLKLILSVNWESAFVSFFFISYVLILILAADAHKKLHAMKTWLTRPDVREHLRETELSNLRFDVQENPIGISGYGIFIIDFDLIKSVSDPSFFGTEFPEVL
jgi:hypothetical protein